MSVKLLTEHDLEFLSLKGGCTGSSESTLVKIPHCWKSHVAAPMHLQIREELTRNLNKTMMENYRYDTTITQAIDDMQIEVNTEIRENIQFTGNVTAFGCHLL